MDNPAPRRLAVALRHETKDAMPQVVASGRGAVAERILEAAFANDIKVREDAELAEILSLVEVECEIPPEAIVAVAEILGHLYRLRRPG